jgi:hypothetical protein
MHASSLRRTAAVSVACRLGVCSARSNEVDGWNMVDYSALGLLANAMNAGRAVPMRRGRRTRGRAW